MRRVLTAAMLAALFGWNPVFAQVGGMSLSPEPSPLGMTSPLGIGPGSPVAPTGIPLGATELASPGLSPAAPGTSPLGPTTGSMTPCSGIGGSMPQTSDGMGSLSAGTASGMGTSTAGISGSTAVFDGGGIAGTASSGCPANGSNSLAGPAASASSPTGMGSLSSAGRVGIPLGSTELGAGGLSPTPGSLTPNPSAPLSTSGSTAPCQTTGMSTTSGSC
jgi:hypothetical protein